MCFLIKLRRHVSHGKRMNLIDFIGQRSKVKVTMDIYGNKLVNTIETKLLCISLSNLADMLTMVGGWILLIWRSEVKGQGHSGHVLKKAMNPIQTKPLCASLSNLADMLTMVNPIDFGGHRSKVKVTMAIIDKCGVRGDATLCVVIFLI